ncbi:MAG: LysR family transcriptional regulator [Burkholderiales bacterium]|nr:LysR family transcriptional regulator [Burkholderiales bacterium]MBS0413556.1 LysR family transcriptional regulator [Pseudomonadota bacterium]
MTRSLNFQQIQAFKAVMESGTTTRAAQMLNTTQPSISRRLAELRQATGLELFDLHNGRLRPTREGQQLYRSVRQHFEGLEHIETAVRVLRKSGTGVLRIGSTPTLAAGLLPRVIAPFMRQHSSIYINLQTHGTPQLKEYLSQGLLDFVLTTGHIEHSDVITTTLLQTHAVCLLPREHALANCEALKPDQLRTQRLILLDENDDIMIAMREHLQLQPGHADLAVETNSSLTICALVAAGVGVGVVNPFVANAFAEQLVVRQLRPPIPVTVTLMRAAALAPSMLASRFVEMLSAQSWSDLVDPSR